MIMVYAELSGAIMSYCMSLDGQTFQLDEQRSHDPSLKRARCVDVSGKTSPLKIH